MSAQGRTDGRTETEVKQYIRMQFYSVHLADIKRNIDIHMKRKTSITTFSVFTARRYASAV